MNIGIVAWSILENVGGLEHVSCDLAKELVSRGHTVTLLCKEVARKKAGTGPLCEIPPGCDLEKLKLDYDTPDLDEARKAILRREFDVCAALFSWDSLLWFPSLLRGTGVPLVISEHARPEWINARWNAYERHCCLECADCIHTLLPGFVPEYPERFRDRIRVIPNAVTVSENMLPERTRPERRTIISAGRLVEEPKQFSLLLKAFALLQDKRPDWDLEICGDGPSLEDYRRLAGRLGLGRRLRLPGMLSDLSRRYAVADIFCIPSKVEGFGMVAVEAQALALPVVGFASCTGVNDIVVHGENGFLAEEMTPESLAKHLEALMDDAGLRERMGLRGKEMLGRYAPEKVYDAWEKMLSEAAANKGRTRMRAIEAMPEPLAPEIAGAKELLERRHPFDRARYLHMHKQLQSRGETSPFTEKNIQGFIKKQKKYGFPGYRSPLTELARLGRRMKRLL